MGGLDKGARRYCFNKGVEAEGLGRCIHSSVMMLIL